MSIAWIASFSAPLLYNWIPLWVPLVLVTAYYFFVRDPAKSLSLFGKHVLITGGSKGIGFATAKECLNRGAKVAILARNKKGLEDAAKKLMMSSSDKDIVIISADITDYDGMCAAMKEAFDTAGWNHLDVVFANAGVDGVGIIETMDMKTVKWIMDVNYFGTVGTIKAALPYLHARSDDIGRIVINSSLYGLMSMAQQTAYCASKYALNALAQGLDLELRPQGIDVAVVFPPDVETDQHRNELKKLHPAIVQIQSDGGLFGANAVASGICNAIENGSKYLTWGLDGFLLMNACIGMKQASSLIDTYIQVFLGGVLRMVAMFYPQQWRSILKKHHFNDMKDKNKLT